MAAPLVSDTLRAVTKLFLPVIAVHAKGGRPRRFDRAALIGLLYSLFNILYKRCAGNNCILLSCGGDRPSDGLFIPLSS